MANNIILLTKSYPYNIGEDFLENEIEILSKRFDEIIIVATAVSGRPVKTRNTPDNVRCYAIGEVANRKQRYAKYIIKGSKFFYTKQVREELKGHSEIKIIMAIIYFAGKVNELESKIRNIPDLNNALSNANDTIIYSYWFSDLAFLAYQISMHFHNIKYVSRAHGYDLYEERNPGGYMPFRKAVLSKIERVFPCSEDGAEYLKKRYSDYSEKIKCSYLGTLDYGINNVKEHSNFHIVTCSSLIPLKRVNIVVDAISLLEEKGVAIEWTCIGDGKQYDYIKQYSGTHLKKTKVNFLGRIPNLEVIHLYQNNSIDLFINASETEGLPVSIMEAISFGIPVVATNVGGTKEIVVNNVTGLLVPKEISGEDLEKAILKMMNYPLNREKVRDYWNKHFNGMTNYANFTNELRNI